LQDTLRETAREAGAFELVESCFGAKRGCGKRGCRAAGKIAIFSFLKRNGTSWWILSKTIPEEALCLLFKNQSLKEALSIQMAGSLWRACPQRLLYYDHYCVYRSTILSRIRACIQFARRKSHI